MKKLLALLLLFGIVGCVTSESVKTLSDYNLCLNHSSAQISESVWRVYDDELESRKSLDCMVHAKRIAEYKERERKRSEALQGLSEALKESNANKSGRYSTNTNTNTSTKLTKMWLLDRQYVEGTQKVCVYKNLGKVHYITHKSQWTPCKPSVRL
jgi:TPP-dependent 2-oxoacid decarboxylase